MQGIALTRGRAVGSALAAAALLAAPATAEAPGGAARDVASLVHSLAGTERGGTFPGAATPFGMVQYSPNTEAAAGGGYRYSRPRTWGFAMTHLSGPGCSAMGDVVSLPTVGPVESVATTSQRATFSHAAEQASPGSYAVTLQPSGVRAELTATTRTGWARFAYPPGTRKANVVVDPGAGFRGTRNAWVRVVGDRTIEGAVGSWGYWNTCPDHGPNHYTVYFSMRFDRPFAAYGTGNGARLHRHQRSASGRDAGAYAVFAPASDPQPVVSKVGISYVDLAGARRNLAAETDAAGFDFDGVRAAAHAAWAARLGRIDVEGGSASNQATFYTALYHVLLHPSVFSDADGRYVGFDGRVHRVAAGHAHYTSFSLWDTYRGAHQVIDLVAPDVVADMMGSLLADGDEGGWLPKWVYGSYYSNEMIGDPAANVLVDAALKGLLPARDVQRAYRAVLRSATDVPDPKRTSYEGRVGLEDYVNRGYIPYRAVGDYLYSGSMSLEYAVSDCAVALLAQRLGKTADARYLLRRSKRYRAILNGRASSVQARAASGAWLPPLARAPRRGFKEGSPEQYTWLVPQDVAGLAARLGGTAAALGRLDAFFDYPAVAAKPAARPRGWIGAARFTPRNEEDLQAPYLYDYLGQPWKTQDVVRATRAFFGTGPNGLPGSDDLGALSSWYVLSALGMYPVMGGDDAYALTTPLFDRATIAAPRPGGGPIVIDAPGASGGAAHIRSVSVDGRPLATSELGDAALRGGAHVVYSLGSEPDPSWATGPNVPASACSANPATADIRVRVVPASAGRLRVRVVNAGDAQAGALRIALRLPRGLSARPLVRAPRSLRAGGRAAAVWVVRGQTAAVRVEVSWEGPGGAGGAQRSFATGEPRPSAH